MKGDIEGAAQQYERVLGMKERVVGGDLEEIAEMQFSLAGMYIGWNNYGRARELLSESIGIFKRKKGPRLAVTFETLAFVEECLGRYQEAITELGRAGKVWESCGADRAGELAENMQRRAELLDQLRKKTEADWLRERGWRARPEDFQGESMFIAYAVAAGLGQLGLNGQLLTPYAGSRCRTNILTTDAPLVHDEPKDFGIVQGCRTRARRRGKRANPWTALAFCRPCTASAGSAT